MGSAAGRSALSEAAVAFCSVRCLSAPSLFLSAETADLKRGARVADPGYNISG